MIEVRYWREKLASTGKAWHLGPLGALQYIARAKRTEFGAYLAAMTLKRPAAQTKFVILATPRSGSNVLADLLNHHPGIACDGEILLFGTAFPMLCLEGSARRRRDRVYGFRLMLNTLQRDLRRAQRRRLLAELVHGGWKIISLRRNDCFRQAVSVRLAYASGRWFQLEPSARSPRFRLEVREVRREMDWLTAQRKLQDDVLGRLPHLDLVYEEALQERAVHQRTADKVCEYLGIAPASVSASLRQQHPGTLAEYVENYEEIEAGLGVLRR